MMMISSAPPPTRFELSQVQNIPGCSGVSVVRGCEFNLNPIEPILLENEDGPNLYTSQFFAHTTISCFFFSLMVV